MRNLRTVITALVMVLFATGWAFAQGPHKGGMQQGRARMEKSRQQLYEQLNLSEQQQKQLEENRQAEAKNMLQLRQTIRQKQMALQKALNDPAVTREQVEPLANEIKTLQGELIDDRMSNIFAVKQILTPEQYAKFNQIMKEKKEEQGGKAQGWREKINNWSRQKQAEPTAK
jgi:Spy/CpxP family protein refolding chaperone